MNNLRESEIRKESLDIVVETYRVANMLKTSSKPGFRTKLVDSAFLVSSSIAKAFITLQNEQIESEIELALKEIESIRKCLLKIEKKTLLEKTDLHPLSLLLNREQVELEELLIKSRIINAEAPSPKLEKVCI
jgi:hypothetical protein